MTNTDEGDAGGLSCWRIRLQELSLDVGLIVAGLMVRLVDGTMASGVQRSFANDFEDLNG